MAAFIQSDFVQSDFVQGGDQTPTATDAPSVSESVTRAGAFSRTTTDAPTVSESVVAVTTIERATTDAPSLSESISEASALGRTATDSASTSESLTRAEVLARATTDAPAFSESILATPGEVRTTTDAVTLTDAATMLRVRHLRSIIGRHLRATGVTSFGGGAAASSGSTHTDTFSRTVAANTNGTGWSTSEIPNATWEAFSGNGTWSVDGAQGVVVTSGAFNGAKGDLNFSVNPFLDTDLPIAFRFDVTFPSSSGLMSFELKETGTDFDLYLEKLNASTDLTAELVDPSPGDGPTTVVTGFSGGLIHVRLVLTDTLTSTAIWEGGSEPAPQVSVITAPGTYLAHNWDNFEVFFVGPSSSAVFNFDDFCIGIQGGACP